MPIISDPKVPLDNKQLRHYDKDGNYIRTSVDEAIARGLNKWKGWNCSAGSRYLYIDYDTNIWACNTASSKINRFNDDGWNKVVEEKFGPAPHDKYIQENGLDKNDSEEWWTIIGEEREKFYKGDNAWHTTLKKQNNIFGLYGNIIEGFELPDKWTVCPFASCGCGADVIVSKAKDRNGVNQLAVSIDGYDGQHRTKDNIVESIEEPVAVEMDFPIPYQVLWDVGRRCNYDCFYCWDRVHDNVSEHHDYEKIFEGTNKILKWAEGDQIRWNFGGGEPTMHPNFVEWMKYLKDNGQWTMVTTNGTRSPKYWKELVPNLNSINMSAHFASMIAFPKHLKNFVTNTNIIMDHHDTVDDDHWLEIKLMTPPGWLDYALEFKDKIDTERLKAPGANGRMKGTLSLVPIRSIADSGKLVDYSKAELEYFKNQ